MQVNRQHKIELIFKEHPPIKIFPLDSTDTILISIPLNYKTTKGFSKPCAFKWPDSYNRKPTPKLVKWFEEVFKQIFEYDPVMWMASCATLSPEWKPILKDLFNDK